MAYIRYLEGVFTPTLTGGTTAGTTTYSSQVGNYILIGSTVTIFGRITISAATGTGDATIGGLPFAIKNVAGTNPWGNMGIDASGWTWPTGRTMASLLGLVNSTNSLIACSGSATSRSNMQMTNAAATFNFSMTYQVD